MKTQGIAVGYSVTRISCLLSCLFVVRACQHRAQQQARDYRPAPSDDLQFSAKNGRWLSRFSLRHRHPY